ncbi:hypothetical protein GQ457_06G014660 [Hibiscus cannabinus]
MNATGPNGPIGMDASHSDGFEGVSFSWDDGVVDEGSYESEENNSDSDWLGGGHLLSDDDDEEITSIKKIRLVRRKIKNSTVSAADLEAPVAVGSEQLNEVDVNEAYGNEVDVNETDGNEEARDEQQENGPNENETDLVDVGSYETDSDGDVISKKSGQVYFDSSTAHPRFELGMIFENSQQFKEALYAYAVGNRFDFKFVFNKKEKVRVVCKGKACPFVVHASRDKSDGCFKVKTLVTDHNCSVTFKNSRANFKFVGKHFISKLRILPTLRSCEMIKLGREELNVELNKKLCFRARKWDLEKIRGSVVHEFHRLWDYVNTLRAADVRGTFDLVVERPNATDIPKFRRIYVCFSALREGFKLYCRPVIGLDGCFLKGSFKGEILSAVGRDCNNQIFPIAWAVVEVENRETWAWFLNNLQCDIGFGDGDGCTLLSDMQKGLLEEVPLCFPKIEHRFCARHMYANWRKVHKGGDMQMLFWKCCKATTQSEFAKYANRIGKLKGKAYDDLMEKNPIHWSKAFFSTSSKCDAVDNNFSEAFNSAIIGARFKSIISMLEDIRQYVMNRIVEHKKKKYVIGLYKKQKYQELYSVVMPTVASEKFWKDCGMGQIDPPLHRKMPGRPKHKRRREEGGVRGRTKLRKLGSKLSCRLCGGIGHNVENDGPSPTPSVPPSSQASYVPPSSQIPSPPSSQTSDVPPQSAPQSTPTMVFMPTPYIQQLSELDCSSPAITLPVNQNKGTSTLGRPSQVLLSRPHTRSFTKPTSQPTSTTATSPVAAPVLLARPHTSLIACEGLVLLEKGVVGGVVQVKQLQGLRRKRCCSIQERMMSTKILQHWCTRGQLGENDKGFTYPSLHVDFLASCPCMWEDFLGSRDATAYWSAEQTKCRKDKAAKIFCCSHGTLAGIVPHVKGIFPYSVRAQNPRTSPIKGTLKELIKRAWKKRERRKGEER